MKKILTILTLVLTVSFNSCSSDDNNSDKNGISVKINGSSKKFKNIEVETVNYPDYSDYIITAKQSDDATKTIEIKLEKGEIGSEVVYFIQYFNGESYFNVSGSGIISNISENSDTIIKGTFSGSLSGSSGTVTITDGTINAKP